MITVEEVKKLRADYMKAQDADDVEACLSYWDEEGALMPPNQPIVLGIEAMRPWYVRRFSQIRHGVDIHFDDFMVSKEWSMAQGRFEGSFIPRDGSNPIEVRGKYLELHKRQADGSLKFYRHMWSSDLP
jgi:ketosteroid isomerase-like protein